MIKRTTKFIVLCLSICIMLSLSQPIYGLKIKELSFDVDVKSAVLMDAATGTVLYEKNSDLALPPASVTKIMTLLLVFESIESGILHYDDILVVSENAASMGGSQVYLKVGEKMTVEELIKCVIIASANDAAVTLAEAVAGSEESFISMMNEKARELGMKNTYFENATGLDDTAIQHLTSAYDIAIMSRELIKFDKVSKYATIWMDTIRNGEFGLTNTNRLVRYYKGITGLKTGSTAKAGFCMSATARRDNMELICVVMGAKTSEERNACVAKLLDFGFANYRLIEDGGEAIENIKVCCGVRDSFSASYEPYSVLENKGSAEIKKEIIINESITAPIKKGDIVGHVKYYINGECIAVKNIVSNEKIDKINFLQYFEKVLMNFM